MLLCFSEAGSTVLQKTLDRRQAEIKDLQSELAQAKQEISQSTTLLHTNGVEGDK